MTPDLTPLPTGQPVTPDPTPLPTGQPVTPAPTDPVQTEIKHICAKSQPLDSTICAEGTAAGTGGNCVNENVNDGCGGPKTCWWAECGPTTPPPTPTPPEPTTPSPTVTPPEPTTPAPTDTGVCPICAATNEPCCDDCVTGGKPQDRGCIAGSGGSSGKNKL